MEATEVWFGKVLSVLISSQGPKHSSVPFASSFFVQSDIS